MGFWYGHEAPPDKTPLRWISEGVDSEAKNRNGATKNLLQEWRNNVNEE